MDGLERKGSGIQGIDAQVRGAPGVSAPTEELHVLDYVAVAGAADREFVVAHIAGGMAHHCQVNVVELPQANQFLLAAHKLQLLLFPELQPAGYFDELLGRHRKRNQLAGQLFQDFRLGQPMDSTQHHPNLAVVAAGVGGAGFCVGMGMLIDNQGVQFANQGHAGAGAAATGNLSLDAGQGQAGPVVDAQGIKLVSYQLGCLGLAESGFRVVQDLAGYADNIGPVAVNGGASPLFQFLPG